MHFGDEFRKYAVNHLGMSGLALDDYMKHNVQSMTPNIIEERPMRFAAIDVFSRLIMDRIIFLGTPVDDYIANVVVAQLLFLESVDAKKDVLMYINSPGGSVYAGLGMYDTMQYVRPDVATICTSLAASMGAGSRTLSAYSNTCGATGNCPTVPPHAVWSVFRSALRTR